MNKISFILACLLAMVSFATAQDTVSLESQMYKYFRPDPCANLGNVPWLIGGLGVPSGGGYYAKRFHTPDSITIYGIAVGIQGFFQYPAVQDTATDQSYEYVRLDLPDPVTGYPVEINRSMVNIFRNVAYYALFDTVWPSSHPNRLVEMHECFFKDSSAVAGYFFLGMTFTPDCLFGYDDIYAHPIIDMVGIGPQEWDFTEDIYTHFANSGAEEIETVHQTFSLVFPILTPAPDTTSADTTLSAGEPDMLRRYTAVTPNPATGRAKVVSSFGLTMVEAFNAAGEKVHELRLPDAPLTATLDVSRWPTGTYILRLHTPQGVAAKKLVVSR